MKPILTLAAAAALSTAVAIGAAHAAPAGPQSAAPALQGANAAGALDPLLTPARFYPHCRAWARECSWRWGWGNWRWRRCMFRHGC